MNPATSGWAGSEIAARWRPAAQPSVRVTSASTASPRSSSPVASRRSASASSEVSTRSAPRSSVSWPRARSRASGSGGSARVASTTCSPRRLVLEQELQRGVHGSRVDEVVVVEDEERVAVFGGQLVDHRGGYPVEGGRCRRTEQGGHALREPGPHAIERGECVAPEPHWVVVAGVQRQPADEPLASLAPVGEK